MSNRLINETSPYLLQHAENPVDWYPWGDAAFTKATMEDKPIFLSIGYSSCHYCHLMAQESFCNQSVADILNRYYVPIKVDREERPDIDSVYMEVCSSLTGSGGWPLTIIMSPDRRPFYAGTYIPRENSMGRMGLISLLLSLADMWKTQRPRLLETAKEVCSFLNRPLNLSGTKADDRFLKSAVEQLYSSYDEQYGGFGTAPKFPAPQNLLFLLRYAKLSGDKYARTVAERTLQQMYRGGIFDHIGGGFCRYSTDREWLAPHFEKTLYDNALLAYTYTEAWQDGHLPLYKEIAEKTLNYCIEELRCPQGGFYCSQDADSDGVEGKYYLFTPEEVENVLGRETGRHFCECYDILKEGNFRGKSIPNLLINQRWRILPEGYDELCRKLNAYRKERSSLFTDKKILTSWNGLMLMALSKAARAFNSSRYLSEAVSLAEFLITKDENAKNLGYSNLTASMCCGKANISAKLDDYVFLALGLTELSQIHYAPGILSSATALAQQILKHFSDSQGVYYMNSDLEPRLLKRPLELFDGAMPCGNSAAAVLFDRLFRLSGELKWRSHRDRLLNAICSHSEKYPAGSPFALCALLSSVYPTQELVCVCRDIPEALDLILKQYSPALSILVKTPELKEEVESFAPYTSQLGLKDNKSTFYLCSGGKCGVPVNVE